MHVRNRGPHRSEGLQSIARGERVSPSRPGSEWLHRMPSMTTMEHAGSQTRSSSASHQTLAKGDSCEGASEKYRICPCTLCVSDTSLQSRHCDASVGCICELPLRVVFDEKVNELYSTSVTCIEKPAWEVGIGHEVFLLE
jgi:hypothetical protein